MRPKVALPAELRRGPFTRATAEEHGFTGEMLRGARFRRLTREVYVAASTLLTYEVICRAACLAIPEGALSHASAAAAHGLPLGVRERELTSAHLTVPVAASRSRHGVATCHFEDLPVGQVVESSVGPATSPARTFLDRAAELDLPDLVALGDAIVGRGCASVGELSAVVAWGWGRRGVVNARAALPLLDGRSRSAMESRTRAVLVLGAARRPRSTPTSSTPTATGWRPPTWCGGQAKLIVEYDGRVHLTEKQRRVDMQRRNLLTEQGWTIIHVTADLVLQRPWQLIYLVKSQLAAA